MISSDKHMLDKSPGVIVGKMDVIGWDRRRGMLVLVL